MVRSGTVGDVLFSFITYIYIFLFYVQERKALVARIARIYIDSSAFPALRYS